MSLMSYEEFKKEVKDKFLAYMPHRYQNYEVRIDTVQKVNVVLDGLSLKGTVSPTIYVNGMYEEYQKGKEFDCIMQNVAAAMLEAFNHTPSVENIKEDCRDKIVYQLVNTAQNKQLLQKLPHREVLDLSIIYRVIVNLDDEGMQSALITYDVAKAVSMNEEQLYEAAVENTKRILPTTVQSMEEVMAGIMGIPVREDNSDCEVAPIWILGNKFGINGANVMLDDETLCRVADMVDNDLYIIPSSIHEVLVLSAADGTLEQLAPMVYEVNMAEVRLQERLSNQVYYYDRAARKVSLATNVTTGLAEPMEGVGQAEMNK